MPIDPSTDPATHTRRNFLTRSTVGGALLSAVALAAAEGRFLSPAGAQAPVQGSDWEAYTAGDPLVSDEIFADVATPLELAAVQAYLAAAQTDTLDDESLAWAQQFASNHQAVADTLATLLPEGAPAPVPEESLAVEWTTAIEAAADQDAVLALLATVEEGLIASHLSAMPVLRDKVTAKTVAQVIAIEAQQRALLIVRSGGTIAEATPAIATPDASLIGREAAAEADAAESATTTAAN